MRPPVTESSLWYIATISTRIRESSPSDDMFGAVKVPPWFGSGSSVKLGGIRADGTDSGALSARRSCAVGHTVQCPQGQLSYGVPLHRCLVLVLGEESDVEEKPTVSSKGSSPGHPIDKRVID